MRKIHSSYRQGQADDVLADRSDGRRPHSEEERCPGHATSSALPAAQEHQRAGLDRRRRGRRRRHRRQHARGTKLRASMNWPRFSQRGNHSQCFSYSNEPWPFCRFELRPCGGGRPGCRWPPRTSLAWGPTRDTSLPGATGTTRLVTDNRRTTWPRLKARVLHISQIATH